jgi:hypothetical protein
MGAWTSSRASPSSGPACSLSSSSSSRVITFESHFRLVRQPNEKGHVENLVGFARRNFRVPIPVVDTFATLNDQLLGRCQHDLSREFRGKGRTKEAGLQEEREALLVLPAPSFSACRVVSTRVTSLSLVCFDTKDYSVPARFGHRRVVVFTSVDTVRIECEGILVAEHPCCWDRHRTIFNPIHYLALLERKPGALDFARPLAEWPLPACFANLRSRLEADDSAGGTVQYIRALRLPESASLEELVRAVKATLARSSVSADVVRIVVEAHRQKRAEPLSLECRPQLQAIHVPLPDLTTYQGLLARWEVAS